MPELGVEGAAISSIISRVLAAAVFFWLLYQALEVRIEWADYYRLSNTSQGDRGDQGS